MELDLFKQRKILLNISPVSIEKLSDESVLADPSVRHFVRFFDCDPDNLNLERLSMKMAYKSMYPLPFSPEEISYQTAVFISLEKYGFDGLESFVTQVCEMSFTSVYRAIQNFPVLNIKKGDKTPYNLKYYVEYAERLNSYATVYEDDGLYASSFVEETLDKTGELLKTLKTKHPRISSCDGELVRASIHLNRGHETLAVVHLLPRTIDGEVPEFSMDWGRAELEIECMSRFEKAALLKSLTQEEQRFVSRKLIESSFDL